MSARNPEDSPRAFMLGQDNHEVNPRLTDARARTVDLVPLVYMLATQDPNCLTEESASSARLGIMCYSKYSMYLTHTSVAG